METVWKITMRDTVFVLKCTDGGKTRMFASPLSPKRELQKAFSCFNEQSESPAEIP